MDGALLSRDAAVIAAGVLVAVWLVSGLALLVFAIRSTLLV